MTDVDVKTENELRDLFFELEEGEGPRLLICVCDEKNHANQLRLQINARLANLKKSIVTLILPTISGNFIDAVLSKEKSGNIDVVHLVESENISTQDVERLFGELNFQRDSLAKLKIPVILWLTSEQLPILASRAPDFWSRRSAIYYFDQYPISRLLSKMFEDRSGHSTNEDSLISQALTGILTSERQLRECLLNTDSFSLSRADLLIQKIRIGLDTLLTECDRGSRIEVTLWLWNVTHMDDLLEYLAWENRKLPEHSALFFERSDLVIELADNIENILGRYADGLDERIRLKQIVSILRYFADIARARIRAAVENVEKEQSHKIYIDDFDDASAQITREDWMERVFRVRAAESFERWLAGYAEERPRVFSEEEGRILKYLYNKGSTENANPPVPEAKLLSMIKSLRVKVRLYLGDIHIRGE